MDKKTVLFRADVSNIIGMGHMIRCFNFVEALPIDIHAVFLMKEATEQASVNRLLIENGWKVYYIPYEASIYEDAIETARIAKIENAQLIVTDLCHRFVIEQPEVLSEFHRALKTHNSPFILSIEDCRMHQFDSDVAIVWNSNANVWSKNNHPNCSLLVGSKYFICSPQFSLPVPPPLVREKAVNILVCIGGSDPRGITLKILESIFNIPSLKICAILGDGTSSTLKFDVSKFCEKQKNITVLSQTNEMAGYLKWADLAILGEGLVKCEAAIVGTPSIIVSQFDHDSKPLVDFFKIGCARHLCAADDISKVNVPKVILDILNNYEVRQKMSEAGIDYFDGKGAIRIYNKILKKLFVDH